MRDLILVRGAPGSGKSTWVAQNNLQPYCISSDAVRLMFSSPEIDPSTGEVMKDAQGNPIFEFKLEPENTKNSVYGFQDKHMLLPIPYTELNVNPNIKQNTGW